MFKKIFTKIFNELIKPFEDRIKNLEARPVLPRKVKMVSNERVDAPKTLTISKVVATENLTKYEKEFQEFKRTTNRTDMGSEVEFYERGNKKEKKSPELKTQILRGASEIDNFIARAKKGEVRLVRQIR